MYDYSTYIVVSPNRNKFYTIFTSQKIQIKARQGRLCLPLSDSRPNNPSAAPVVSQWKKLPMVSVPHRSSIQNIINDVRISGLLIDKKQTITCEYLCKRSSRMSELDLNIRIEHETGISVQPTEWWCIAERHCPGMRRCVVRLEA
jgi:hypothetical protein